MLNAFSVDVEDYFHPSEVQRYVTPEQWDGLPSRVEGSTRLMLRLLDRRGVRATFYVLGWVAERHPELIRSIAGAGHEIGCHSYAHQLVYDLTPEQFRADTLRALEVIQQACGVRCTSYRAPSYSITEKSLWALEILAGLGFTHDSSIYPIEHDRYGIPGFGLGARRMATAAGSILEVPPATVRLSSTRVCPVGGGGYLRLLPYRYTAAGVRRINQVEERPACLYVHPWEVDPGQPRLAKGRVARWRTYSGLEGMEAKLERLMSEFQFSTVSGAFPV